MMKKLIVFFLILLQFTPVTHGTMSNIVPAQAMAVPPGLVAAYGFEEATGKTLFDVSGNSNNGKLKNGPIWVTNGKFGKALRFDGTDDLVSIADSNSLDLTTGMTLEAWVFPTSSMSGWDAILIKEHASGQIYSLHANGDGNTFHAIISNNSTGYKAGGSSFLPD